MSDHIPGGGGGMCPSCRDEHGEPYLDYPDWGSCWFCGQEYDFDPYYFTELLTAIGLSAAYTAEVTTRLRLGLLVPSVDTFLNSASPLFLRPPQFLRALQLGIEFCAPPPGVKLGVVGGDGSQNGGGLGADHRVGGGAQRVYPFRGNP